MLKKVLLMIAVMIFAFSCSSPSDPNNGNNNGGNDSGNSGNTGENKDFPELLYLSGINAGDIILSLRSNNFESGDVSIDFQSTPKDYSKIPDPTKVVVTVTGLTFDNSDQASIDIGLVKEDFTITFNKYVTLSKNGVDKMKTKLKDGEYSKVKLQVKFSLEGYNDLTVDNLAVQCIRENTGK
ncbi:hypothetical protein R4K48_08415 [Brachyspira pulli]|uniref:hypothetical protein n=2 Tax=Brachyspira pulli TaxID=310721 RepID=UPI0030076C02